MSARRVNIDLDRLCGFVNERQDPGDDVTRELVGDYLNGGRWKLVGEFTEVESGKRSDRPELEKALTACRKHKAKLVIAKLDRLSRNVHFISGLMERKVDFVACDMPSPNAFMINVYAAVAQEERRMISDRTKAGLAAAKARGVKLGGPRLPAINETRQADALAACWRAGGLRVVPESIPSVSAAMVRCTKSGHARHTGLDPYYPRAGIQLQ